MAAGAFDIYENGLLKIGQQTINWNSDTFKAALLLATHTPNLVTHDFFDDVVANECADADYTAGGVAISPVALSIVAGKLRFDAADISFGASVTITAKYLLIYKDTGVAATSPLLFICDLNTAGGSVSSTASVFSLALNAAGVYEITANV